MTPSEVALLSAAVFLLLLERLWPRRKQAVCRPGADTDVSFLAAGYLLLATPTVWAVTAATQHLGASWGPRIAGCGLPLWLHVAVAVVFLDFAGYWVHRLLHRVGFLWEFHKLHHSARHMDWLTTFRSHIVEQVVRRALTPIILVVLGIPLEAILVAAAVLIAWAMLGHANLGFQPRRLEWLLITPRLHYLHHVPATCQRNFAVVFSCWDRWWGTLATESTLQDHVLGLPEEPSYPHRFVPLVREPFRRILAEMKRRWTKRSSR